MAAIVYLDIDDEITSAAARLRALDERRIALVLPLGSRLATSRINFRLLAREAEANHKAIEIVTGDASARALAASAGLPTHLSVASFEAGPSATAASGPGRPGDSPTAPMPVPPAMAAPEVRPPVPVVGRRPGSRNRGRGIAVVLALVALLAFGGVAGLQLLPSATIRLVPAVEEIGPIELHVTAQPGITEPDPIRLLVAATTFEFDVEASAAFPATGAKVEETTAGGSVTFTNCDINRAVRIGAGSVVATPGGVRFLTNQDVTVKRAQLGIFQIDCKSADVGIVAEAPGIDGNVGANAITVIPAGFATNVLFVTNPGPTIGGTHVETKEVAQADVDAALAALDADLAAEFAAKIAAPPGVPAGTTVFAETATLGAATPTTDPAIVVGTVTEFFDLGATAHGTVVGVDAGTVSTLADARIRSSVPDGFGLVEDSVSIDVGVPLVSGSTITFPVVARATAVPQLDEASLRARIRGAGLPQARTILGEYGEVTITVWPDWVTTIPSNDERVTFSIEAAPGGSPDPSPAASGAGTP